MLSASAMSNIRTAMNRGAFDFLTKPIDFLDFETTLAKAIRHVEVLRDGGWWRLGEPTPRCRATSRRTWLNNWQATRMRLASAGSIAKLQPCLQTTAK